MPFYTFKCPKCDITKDELVKMGTTETVCETCGSKTEKQLSMRFNGHGLPNGFSATRSQSRDK